jgi:transcription termination/antitermination protein NusG
MESELFTLRTTANREDQVLDFVAANVDKKGLHVYSLFRPHGLRGYIFVEARSRTDAEEACVGVPYARGLLHGNVNYEEVEHMLEQAKIVVDIRKNDIAEIIAGPFKREKARVVRIDESKEEVVVELLEAAVPIPITVKLDSIKVIRREDEEEENE